VPTSGDNMDRIRMMNGYTHFRFWDTRSLVPGLSMYTWHSSHRTKTASSSNAHVLKFTLTWGRNCATLYSLSLGLYHKLSLVSCACRQQSIGFLIYQDGLESFINGTTPGKTPHSSFFRVQKLSLGYVTSVLVAVTINPHAIGYRSRQSQMKADIDKRDL
jgi:hypothetical protein